MSAPEDTLLFQIKLYGLPEPVREFRFAKPRRWKFDFAWPEIKLAVEVEGAVYTKGRHTRGAGYTNDCIKYNAAVLLGWRVLRFPSGLVDTGAAIEMIRRAINAENITGSV